MPEGGGRQATVARTIAGELDDALYYLRHDCVPCAERHFDLASRLGATREMIAGVWRLAGEPPAAT